MAVGRRIYIHEDSLRALAMESLALAELIYTALVRTTLVKIAHHYLSDARDMGLIQGDLVTSTLSRLSTRSSLDLTVMLRSIGYRSPMRQRDFYPVLAPHESIVASCSEAGYYTYATGKKASDLMYAETGSLRSERAAIRSGRGPSDITLITGQSLAFLDPSLPIGRDTAYLYFGHTHRGGVTDPELSTLLTLIRSRQMAELHTFIDPITSSSSWTTSLYAACDLALTRGIYTNPT